MAGQLSHHAPCVLHRQGIVEWEMKLLIVFEPRPSQSLTLWSLYGGSSSVFTANSNCCPGERSSNSTNIRTIVACGISSYQRVAFLHPSFGANTNCTHLVGHCIWLLNRWPRRSLRAWRWTIQTLSDMMWWARCSLPNSGYIHKTQQLLIGVHPGYHDYLILESIWYRLGVILASVTIVLVCIPRRECNQWWKLPRILPYWRMICG